MSSAKDYRKDFERLMAPYEEKADGLEDEARSGAARQYIVGLKQRAKAVGITWTEVCHRFSVAGNLDGVLADIEARERTGGTVGNE